MNGTKTENSNLKKIKFNQRTKKQGGEDY